MTALPAVPPADDKDWTWVLGRACPDCGFDAAALHRSDLPGLIRGAAEAFAGALARPDATDRPAPTVWSPLEYGGHVRDVCRIFDERARLMLTEDDPRFANWDQDETALADRYWAQAAAEVADQLTVAAATAAQTFAGVDGDQWERTGRRSNGSVFTVDSLGRYFVHDLVHHVHDIA